MPRQGLPTGSTGTTTPPGAARAPTRPGTPPPTRLYAVNPPSSASSAAARASVVVMASGTGSLLEALLARADEPQSPFAVTAIVVDRDCRAGEIAAERGIPLVVCKLRDHADRDAWDTALRDHVAALAPDWVVTAGFMKILGDRFLGRFAGRIVNSHPALLPAFPGAHGVADALAYGVKLTGTTVHLVDSGVDTGPVLAQTAVPVEVDDTEESLHERIKSVERVLLADVVTDLVTRGVVIDGRKAYIP
ncbi:phosphoribosylglycinamide formyltransferase [Gordonia desulfuricans]|uniref:Phosphoribosylglycinamide formyltransferase n=2 Tax=Gordonia desulfuricans TaxID=89051 RepID=A0A7K3LKD5_9ACTN|nr:phosphoribosylglycinamide formyltransferase [Gordonia desulfuricans]